MNLVTNKMAQAPSTSKAAVPEPVLQLGVVASPTHQPSTTQTPDHSLPPAVGWEKQTKTNPMGQKKVV